MFFVSFKSHYHLIQKILKAIFFMSDYLNNVRFFSNDEINALYLTFVSAVESAVFIRLYFFISIICGHL